MLENLNLSTIPENPKQKVGIESRRHAREPETKRMDQIRARCRRTRNKMKGSNLGNNMKGTNPGAMPENSKQTKGLNPGATPENLKQNKRIKFE